jgi:hypothetical protein
MQTLGKLENLALKHGGRCWWCGEDVKEGSIWSDDNRHGINLQGYQEKQIIFFHCACCDRNTSFQNVLPNHQYFHKIIYNGLTV